MHDWPDDTREEHTGLDAALQALAASDATLHPPADLAARTLAAWDALPSSAPRRRGRLVTLAMAAGLAAVLVLAAALPRPIMPGPRPRPTPRPAAGPRPEGVDVALPAPVERVTALAPRPTPDAPPEPGFAGRRSRAAATTTAARDVVRSPRSGRRAQGERGVAPAADTMRFVTLSPDAERELAEGFQLSRVRVPRRVLVGLGLLPAGPVSPGGSAPRSAGADAGDDFDAAAFDAPVEADVAFAEDGQAKAIRLAPVRLLR